jgi:Domain of unknown function (DUF4336)
MALLQPLVEGIWTVSAPHRWIGLHLGTRMTVVRLSTGGLLLHSPIPMATMVQAEVAALGPVAHIVCPNNYHHVYAAEAVAAFPDAMLHGPPALRRKRTDLPFAADLSEVPHADWKNDLVPLTIDGCMLHETVFFHPATKTLITCDLAENFHDSPHWPTRLYLRLAGLYGSIGWSRFLRPVYRDRTAARASVDRLLQWPFERVVISHGAIISNDARDTIRRAFEWL